MTLEEAHKYLEELTVSMEKGVDGIVFDATKAQEAIYVMLTDEINEFDTVGGRYVHNQPISRKMAAIERKIYALIEKYYTPGLEDYLKVYNIVDDSAIFLHKEVNAIDVTGDDIKNVRQLVYNQAEGYLTKSLADAYVQPAKYLMMQVVANGQTIKQGKSMLKNWNEGDLPSGKLSSGVHAPRLQAYAGQIARDSLFQYNGNIQDNIGQKYKLERFLYVGGLVSDSRPFCKHMVGLRRRVNLDEVPKLVEQYPQGLYKDTTKANFPIYRGGYNCNHNVMMVR